MLEKLISILSSNKFNLSNEKETQSQIESEFLKSGIQFEREYYLDKHNIPDFFVDGIVIEVKIKGGARKIYKQCERYCSFDNVKSIVLVTNRSIGMPKQINNKACYIVIIGKQWL